MFQSLWGYRRNLLTESESTWTTKVEVGEEIVQLLSGRIYRTLPIALKELISNSWDADALNVRIRINHDKNQIAVIDDGFGMDTEALKNYPNIAKSDKPKKDVTPGGRPTIGQYGIGVLATLPFCRRVVVQSTIMDSNEINTLTISSEKWIDEDGKRKPPSSDTLDHECYGQTTFDDNVKNIRGTSVILEEVFTAEWNEILMSENRKKTNLMRFSGIDRIAWFLQQYAPIEYNSSDKDYSDYFSPFTKYKPMKLFLNGKELFRNTIEDARILEQERLTIPNTNIECRYMIVTPDINIVPEETIGLQLRMRNVAIGIPRLFDVYSSGKLHGRMRYLGGEIEIIKGFEDQLNLEREDIINCKEWVDFSDYFRLRLSEHAESIRKMADIEKDLGAYAYSLGIPLSETDYGFIKPEAVRATTKKNRAAKSKSAKKLKISASKTLLHVGYTIKRVKSKSKDEVPVKVNHE